MPSTGGAFRCLTTSLALTATLVSPLSSSIAQSGGTVLGNVLDENDQAVPGARITMTPLNTDGAAVEFDAGLDGQFSRSDIDAGFYTISALHETLGSEEYRIRVRPGHTVEARLVLQPGVRSAVFARANDSEALCRRVLRGHRGLCAPQHIQGDLRQLTPEWKKTQCKNSLTTSSICAKSA